MRRLAGHDIGRPEGAAFYVPPGLRLPAHLAAAVFSLQPHEVAVYGIRRPPSVHNWTRLIGWDRQGNPAAQLERLRAKVLQMWHHAKE